MAKGPQPGTMQPFSFVAKLSGLATGETIYLPEDFPDKGPTAIERAVQSAMIRTPALAGRRFTTERLVAVRTSPITAQAIIGITRTE